MTQFDPQRKVSRISIAQVAVLGDLSVRPMSVGGSSAPPSR
jgi:hypothetical protein